MSLQPLREKTFQTDTSHAAKNKDLIQFVNAVGLHTCTDYCLRLTNPPQYHKCECLAQGKPCACGDGMGSASAKKGPASAKKGSGSARKPKDARLRKKECRFGFGEENKLIPFVAIARPGTRIVEEKEAELKINPWDTYLAAMQKKIPDRHGQMQYVSADTLCFDVHAAREDKVCPVWTFWKTRAVWPLDSTEGESYCEDSLMRFKPVRALADVKGNHATYSAAMIAFLEHPHCPAGLQRQVARARLDHDTE